MPFLTRVWWRRQASRKRKSNRIFSNRWIERHESKKLLIMCTSLIQQMTIRSTMTIVVLACHLVDAEHEMLLNFPFSTTRMVTSSRQLLWPWIPNQMSRFPKQVFNKKMTKVNSRQFKRSLAKKVILLIQKKKNLSRKQLSKQIILAELAVWQSNTKSKCNNKEMNRKWLNLTKTWLRWQWLICLPKLAPFMTVISQATNRIKLVTMPSISHQT